jgi:hypothetical protein
MNKKKEEKTSEDTIDAPEWDYLYTAPSQIPDAGLGLFTAIPIYAGEHIARYTGRILTDAVSDQLIAEGEDEYFLLLPDGRILDAGSDVKCAAAYANDACGLVRIGRRNNARFDALDEQHIVLAATRNIKAGEEIFCAYGARYWKKRKKHLSR